MSEADYQWNQYIESIGHGCEIEPAEGKMQCVEPDCQHEWPTGLEVEYYGDEPRAEPLSIDCQMCGSYGELLTTHDVTPCV